VPIAHKDIFVTRDFHSTASSRMLKGYMSPFDATVVERLRDAGMVALGKLNCDEFAMGSSNENSYYGNVLNPWDKAAVPGGSSGGSAAAVAARIAPAATATDTGGSIREPAAFSGVTGIKPTYGRASRWGMIAFASSLDQAGIMTRSAEDAALIFNAMLGFDPKDSTSVERAPEDYTRRSPSTPGVRIGVLKFSAKACNPTSKKAVRGALAEYAKLEPDSDILLPNAALGTVYYVIAPAEASSNLSRFDGVRYGHRAKEYADLVDMYCRSRAEGFGEEVKRRILVGTYVLSHGYYDAYYLQAQKVRRLIAREFEQAFSRVDIICGPTAPTTAFELGAKADDPVQMYLGDIFTIPAPLAGLPALSIPCGFDAAGLPVGLQLMGRHFSEGLLLGAAHRYQQGTDWHLRVPTETPL
jgi:aspartyl-tRNA(Asn)/glutamyl-tRNA(Gln) amidotransferase subunit A